MSALPTLEERRDRKLALAIACLQDAFAHLEDAKLMVMANDAAFEEIERISGGVGVLLTGGKLRTGLAKLAARVKDRIL